MADVGHRPASYARFRVIGAIAMRLASLSPARSIGSKAVVIDCSPSRAGCGSPLSGHVFGLGVLQQPFVAAFSSEAAFLDAAERCGRIGHHRSVEADHPAVQLL